jgi:hypothetical protein
LSVQERGLSWRRGAWLEYTGRRGAK